MSSAHPIATAPATSSAPPGAVAAGMRDLTATELGHLDRLRAHLVASGADVHSASGLGALLVASYRRWARTEPLPDPSGMLAALAVGVGDLVLANGAHARWVLHVDTPTPSPALLSADGGAAVVPFDDVQRRWTASDSEIDATWLERYVAAAATHLGAPAPLPRQRAAEPTPAEPTPAQPPAAPPAASPVDDTATRVPVPAPAPGSGSRRERHGRRAAGGSDAPAVHYRVPSELPVVPSEHAQDLALRALDRALAGSLTDGPTTFAMLDDGTHVRVRHFGGEPDAALAQAEAWLAGEHGARAALSWSVPLERDGSVVVPGLGATDADPTTGADRAVVVLASDAGHPGLVVAHRWAAPAGAVRARVVGVPLIVGPCPPLL